MWSSPSCRCSSVRGWCEEASLARFHQDIIENQLIWGWHFVKGIVYQLGTAGRLRSTQTCKISWLGLAWRTSFGLFFFSIQVKNKANGQTVKLSPKRTCLGKGGLLGLTVLQEVGHLQDGEFISQVSIGSGSLEMLTLWQLQSSSLINGLDHLIYQLCREGA